MPNHLHGIIVRMRQYIVENPWYGPEDGKYLASPAAVWPTLRIGKPLPEYLVQVAVVIRPRPRVWPRFNRLRGLLEQWILK